MIGEHYDKNDATGQEKNASLRQSKYWKFNGDAPDDDDDGDDDGGVVGADARASDISSTIISSPNGHNKQHSNHTVILPFDGK